MAINLNSANMRGVVHRQKMSTKLQAVKSVLKHRSMATNLVFTNIDHTNHRDRTLTRYYCQRNGSCMLCMQTSDRKVLTNLKNRRVVLFSKYDHMLMSILFWRKTSLSKSMHHPKAANLHPYANVCRSNHRNHRRFEVRYW